MTNPFMYPACRCDQSAKPFGERSWVVLVRNGNYSAFNSYRFTHSDYSSVTCLDCGRTWRTKAAYVAKLCDALE